MISDSERDYQSHSEALAKRKSSSGGYWSRNGLWLVPLIGFLLICVALLVGMQLNARAAQTVFDFSSVIGYMPYLLVFVLAVSSGTASKADTLSSRIYIVVALSVVAASVIIWTVSRIIHILGS